MNTSFIHNIRQYSGKKNYNKSNSNRNTNLWTANMEGHMLLMIVIVTGKLN